MRASDARYTAMQVARYTVDKCMREWRPISNLQLQKILYFVQCGHMAAVGRPLFSDDFMAWQHGPVIPEVYRAYSLWGSNLIMERYGDAGVDSLTGGIIDPIIVELRERSPWALVDETHEPGSPWDVVYDGGRGSGRAIPLELIAESCVVARA